jgi:SpoVK/Ycf46/Vps4 family AAA+-type ATPase
MKKKSIVELVRYHAEQNEKAFRETAYSIARDFETAGDYQLAEYIMALMSDANVLYPQSAEKSYTFLDKMDLNNNPLYLPENLGSELLGIANAIRKKADVNKFIFIGAPGTGKTEAVKQLARLLDRDVYVVNFTSLIDSKLGQTQKNIDGLFEEINTFSYLEKVIFLFDEIDALALERLDDNDLREMGRVVSSLLKSLDSVNKRAIIVATTNLYKALDKALKRRFDYTLDFDCYSKEDLLEIAGNYIDIYLKDEKNVEKNKKLCYKILSLYEFMPMPGDLKNIIKTSIVFSNLDDKCDYFRRLYKSVTGEHTDKVELEKLRAQGFTVREIEILTGISKSTIARVLKEDNA